jgi:hypothetical protein
MKEKQHFLSFILIWLGDFISTMGSGLTAFSLGVHVFNITGKRAVLRGLYYLIFYRLFCYGQSAECLLIEKAD